MRDRRLFRGEEFRRKHYDRADDYYGRHESSDEKYDRQGPSEYRGYPEEHYDRQSGSHFGPGFHRDTRIPDNRDFYRDGYVRDRHSGDWVRHDYENRFRPDRYESQDNRGRDFFNRAGGRIKDAWSDWREETMNGSRSLPEHHEDWNNERSDFHSGSGRDARNDNRRYSDTSARDQEGNRDPDYDSHSHPGDSGMYLDYHPDYGTTRVDRSYGLHDREEFGYGNDYGREHVGRGRRRMHFW